MCVVQLNRDFFGELAKVSPRFSVAPHDVLQGCRNKEVLLLQPQFFSGEDVVVGIQNP